MAAQAHGELVVGRCRTLMMSRSVLLGGAHSRAARAISTPSALCKLNGMASAAAPLYLIYFGDGLFGHGPSQCWRA